MDAAQNLIDKSLLLGLCLLTLSYARIELIVVIALLSAVAVSSLCEYLDNKAPPYLCAAYVVMCLFSPGFTYFLPLTVYDCSDFDKWYARYCWAAALPAFYIASGPRAGTAVALLSGAALLLRYRTRRQLKSREEFFELTDRAKEQSLYYEIRNRELMEKQDYEVRIAKLAERNRIAREIHDNIGHLLTRSILQISALGVSHAGDARLRDELGQIKETMSGAMDSIRDSVHDLHDESIDLKMQLSEMIAGFAFCPIELHYDAGELPGVIKYCFIAVAREALSNIARHSDATEAAVSVAEHPAFCRMTVEDNGTAISSSAATGGIGLSNMASRVEALGGVFRAEYDNGFKIFITVPKELMIRGGV